MDMNIYKNEYMLDRELRKINRKSKSVDRQLLNSQLKTDAVNINAVTNPKVLSIPTYDLNPSVGHPSVEYIPQGFKGYKYWMAYTPFPAEARENPCIVVSNDGEHWINPPWFTNPIASQADAVADGLSYNSDTEIILMKDGKMGVYWRAFKASPKREVIYLSTLEEESSTWSARQKIIDTSEITLSPSVVINDDGTYNMYTINQALAYGSRLQKRTSEDGITWSVPTTCVLSTGVTLGAWHIAVKRVSDGYVLLLDSDAPRKLYYYKSTDGITFNGSTNPLVKSSNSGWDNRGYYRSSFLVLEENPPKLWVFANGMDGTGATEYLDVWKIGSKIANKMPIYTNRNASNLLVNSDLYTGTGGVATGFTSLNSATVSVVYTIDGGQKIEITGGTVVTAGKIKQEVIINPLSTYTFSTIFKTLGNVSANIFIDWYNGGAYLSTTITSLQGESSSDFDLYTSGVITPNASATKCTILLGVLPNNIGDVGSGWFKEAVFVAN